MATVKENLIAARAQFQKYGGRGIHAAFRATVQQDDPSALDTLVALRNALPDGYADFAAFESSRHWRAKEAYRVFDRAIAACDEVKP